MTVGKASALTLAVIGAFGLGLWMGPRVATGGSGTSTSVVQGSGMPQETPAANATAPAVAPRPAAKLVTLAATAENVQDHVKPLLNKGADLKIASSGFRDAETFVTVAHAARNTEIPFMLLKHRVLNEKQSLSSAIRASKPDINASLEASRARAEAKSDIAKLRS